MIAKEKSIASLFFMSAFVFLGADVYDDISHGSSWTHILEESIVLILNFAGVSLLWGKYLFKRGENLKIPHELDAARDDLKRYKAETKALTQGLSGKIDEQLGLWGLSQAEKEVSLLLLKGLSSKEIASLRGTSEGTVRQQGTSIYQKSQLSGRVELSAFFLEDILLL